jgi:GNAT superfamily N-acetyltransferase
LPLAVTFEIIPAHGVPLAAQAATFTEAFRGYLGGPSAVDATALGRFIHAQGIDLCSSRFARSAPELCGFGYITRTGDLSRLAGMGVLAASRRTGVARGLLQHLLDEAKARGDRMMVLEVIEQNPPACALYEKEGFRSLARLCGWWRPPGGATAELSREFAEISLAEASQIPSTREFPELPWQISRHAVAKFESARAFASDRALAVISDPPPPGQFAFTLFLRDRLFPPSCSVTLTANSWPDRSSRKTSGRKSLNRSDSRRNRSRTD